MAKPFKSRKEIAKGFQKKPPRVFKKYESGGAVTKGRGGKFKGIS